MYGADNGKAGGCKNKPDQSAEQKPLWQRLVWLVVIWCTGVSALALVAYLLRLFMTAAGMSAA